MNSKDSIVYTDEYYSLYDEEEGEVEFHMVARITLADKQYAVFEDPDDDFPYLCKCVSLWLVPHLCTLVTKGEKI